VDQPVLEIAIDELMADPSQPRKTFVKEAIDRLAASIRARGIQQPLRVLRDEERGCWLILTGESRWRAARQAGLTHVPCIPVKDQLSEACRLADRLTENMVRDDLRPMEEAAGIARLKALMGCNSKTLVDEYGFSGAAITRAEGMLTLPPDIQAMVGTGTGMVPPSAAYELSRLDDPQAQMELAHAIAAGKLNRDRVAALVRDQVGTRKLTPKASRLAVRSDGMSVSITASEPLTWDGLLATIDRIRKAAKTLYEGGKPVTDLAKALKG
jgi:ParB family transcriptional regulator, chromosome partitioning protein